MTTEPVFIDDLQFLPYGERGFLALEGSEGYICVQTEPSSKGYLWAVCKLYGHAETLEDAMLWARTITEQLAAPANQRSMQDLGPTPALIKKMNIA